MSYAEHGRPLTDLIGGLASDFSSLFRKEVQLAKTEAREKVDLLVGAGQKLAIGAVLGIGAVGVLFAAMVTGLAAVFVAWNWDPTLAHGLSALIIAVVFGLIAWALISSALSSMRADRLALNRTARSLAEDAAVVTRRQQ